MASDSHMRRHTAIPNFILLHIHTGMMQRELKRPGKDFFSLSMSSASMHCLQSFKRAGMMGQKRFPCHRQEGRDRGDQSPASLISLAFDSQPWFSFSTCTPVRISLFSSFPILVLGEEERCCDRCLRACSDSRSILSVARFRHSLPRTPSFLSAGAVAGQRERRRRRRRHE